jgi:hypothetical protein
VSKGKAPDQEHIWAGWSSMSSIFVAFFGRVMDGEKRERSSSDECDELKLTLVILWVALMI